MAPGEQGQTSVYGVVVMASKGELWRRRFQRHPLEVTSDRIADHMEKYHERLSGAEKDALSIARYILEHLVEGKQ